MRSKFLILLLVLIIILGCSKTEVLSVPSPSLIKRVGVVQPKENSSIKGELQWGDFYTFPTDEFVTLLTSSIRVEPRQTKGNKPYQIYIIYKNKQVKKFNYYMAEGLIVDDTNKFYSPPQNLHRQFNQSTLNEHHYAPCVIYKELAYVNDYATIRLDPKTLAQIGFISNTPAYIKKGSRSPEEVYFLDTSFKMEFPKKPNYWSYISAALIN